MKKYIFLVCTLLLISLPNTILAQNIVINEILASNSSINTDEDSSYQDWIELYNKGTVTENLSGYGLSDDALLLYKWTFPNVSLAPGQYLLVWASDKNRIIPGSPLHANFKISASGETILLTNTSGTTIDTAPPVNLPPDVSYGRLPNGTGPFVFFGTPTPNAINAPTGYSGALNPPVFSQNSGFFTSGFNLTLSSPDSGTTILYTLDSSEPDENNLTGTTYTYKNQYPELPGQATGPLLTNSYKTFQFNTPLPIADRSSQANKVSAISSTFSFDPSFYIPDNPVFKGTVVRVKTIKPGYLPSKVATRNYFISPQGNTKFSLPVVSLSLNEDRFYDYQNGIYVAGIDFDNWRAANPTVQTPSRLDGNYVRDGIENEKLANMSYFVNGVEVINQDVGLRIRGASTRRYENKSLTVYARSDYGDATLDYRFFSDLSYTSYDRLTLSNSGNDFRNTMFRDALNHAICKPLYPEKEAYQPAISFINGEFWGIINLRERYDNNYFKRVYNTNATDFLENNATPKEGDAVNYNAMTTYVSTHSLATPANFDYIKTQLDPDSFTDFFISNIFFQNSDWPNNNVQYWRNKIPAYNPTAPYGLDGRWRWMYHDMDDTFSFGTNDFNGNTLAIATSFDTSSYNPEWSTLLLRKLLENSTFKNDFINRFADLLNTSFLSTRIISKMNEMKAVIAPEIPGQITRWSVPQDGATWQYYLDYQTNFANARPAFQRDHIRSKFGIDANINATLDVSNSGQGYVKINTIDIIDGTPGITGNPYPWTGIYFKNIPLKLKAVAKPGFIFSHWTGASTSTNPEIVITPSANFAITAVFSADGPVETLVPIYFWMMDGSIVNGAQLTSLNATYKVPTGGSIQYQSCIAGYPFSSGNVNFGKASMERRNLPTSINYRPEANGNAVYNATVMKGLQIKEPLQSDTLENLMVFNLATSGYKKIKFSFAAINELTNANAISLDYSINPGAPVWITTGLLANSLPLTTAYQLFEIDFSSIPTIENNPDFKVRLRFTGSNMTNDTGARLTFNNIAVDGVKMPLAYPSPNIFSTGSPITNLNPSSTEAIISYSISPPLPTGLSLNTTTGVISGTPTAVSSTATYRVTALISGGSITFGISITVNEAAPNSLSYNSPNVFTKNTPIANLNPTITGTVSSYSVSPSLPNGLSLNTTTGVISGTPTAVSAAATYTVTALNSGGNATFGISITVNEAAPNSLSYNSPNVFTKNTPIANLNPTITGTVSSYSVSPSLPNGLSLNTTTGVISGTPTAVSAAATYTVTALNTGGNATFGISITVNEAAPNSLSYNSPNVFTKNTPIANLNPTVTGTVSSYSVSPSLPNGLSLNTTTGVISGTPTAVSAAATYTVTALNTGGNATFGISITVNEAAPNCSLSYNSPNIFTKNVTITNLNPIVAGGSVSSYSINPSLPSGLSINTATGVISGTPTVTSATKTYTITALNPCGSSTFNVVITINNIAPATLSYSSPNVFTKNTTIANLNPTISGGAVLLYFVSPSLPSGLTLNSTTGVISGMPTTAAITKTYTVTALNSLGSTSFGLVITVNNAASCSLSYNSPNVFVKNTAIVNLNPTLTGGSASSYSVAPNLPSGLSLNTTTGVISGTPSVSAPMNTYTITALNSCGSSSFGLVITVNNAASCTISYNSPNVFVKNTAIINLNPTLTGGSVSSYSVAPSLPSGLSLNATTGVISGTPTGTAPMNTYTITALNSCGSSSFGIVITVNNAITNSLTYPSPNIFTKNTPIPNLNPTISGTVLMYYVIPSLPRGLVINVTTGLISGTPTTISATKTYTVTALKSTGSISFGIVITVNDVVLNSYINTGLNIFTIGEAISNVLPQVSTTGNSYNITPDLPKGLSLNETTGVISGTPTAVSETSEYTIIAHNPDGNTSINIAIAVEAAQNNEKNVGAVFKIYPNPFTDKIYFSGLSETVFYKIFSIDGKLIQQGMTVESQIDFRDLPSGLYLLKLFPEGAIETRRIIKL